MSLLQKSHGNDELCAIAVSRLTNHCSLKKKMTATACSTLSPKPRVSSLRVIIFDCKDIRDNQYNVAEGLTTYFLKTSFNIHSDTPQSVYK